MDSSGAPHRAHIVSPWIPRDRRFLFTAMQPVINCQRKWFNLGGHRTFQQCAFNNETDGPYSGSVLTLSGYTRSTS